MLVVSAAQAYNQDTPEVSQVSCKSFYIFYILKIYQSWSENIKKIPILVEKSAIGAGGETPGH